MVKYTSKEIVDTLFESSMKGLANNTERIIVNGFKPNTKHVIRDNVYVEFIPTVSGVRKVFYYKHSRVSKNTVLHLIKRV